jgi:hypothetical protein
MIKLKADIFEYVGQCVNAGEHVSVLLPMSSYRKRSGEAVMGAGVLRRFCERFPHAPTALGVKLPPVPEHDMYRDAGATGAITAGVDFSGVNVHAWLIQPRLGFASDVYPHLAERFGVIAGESMDEEQPDIPGWACTPWQSAIRASIPRIGLLAGRVVIPYPNLGGRMSNDAFNEEMSILSDSVTVLTGTGGVR